MAGRGAIRGGVTQPGSPYQVKPFRVARETVLLINRKRERPLDIGDSSDIISAANDYERKVILDGVMESLQNTTAIEEEAAALEAISLRLSWVMRRRMEQELVRFGLTMPQYMALRCMERSAEQGCSMTDLAESSHQVLPTMTGIVDRLEERGLVVRERDPRDRRSLRVRLSEDGLGLMDRIAAQKRAWSVRVLKPLSPEERATAIGVLERYLNVVESELAQNA